MSAYSPDCHQPRARQEQSREVQNPGAPVGGGSTGTKLTVAKEARQKGTIGFSQNVQEEFEKNVIARKMRMTGKQLKDIVYKRGWGGDESTSVKPRSGNYN